MGLIFVNRIYDLLNELDKLALGPVIDTHFFP